MTAAILATGLLLGCGAAEPVEKLTATATPGSSDVNPVLIAVEPTSSPRQAPSPSPSPRHTTAGEPGGDDPEPKAGRGAVIAEIRDVFGRHADAAIRIARCESELNPRATGKASERGVFQLHPVHRRWIEPRWGWGAMYQVRPNIEAAHHLFKREGFRPWRFSSSCHGVTG